MTLQNLIDALYALADEVGPTAPVLIRNETNGSRRVAAPFIDTNPEHSYTFPNGQHPDLAVIL